MFTSVSWNSLSGEIWKDFGSERDSLSLYGLSTIVPLTGVSSKFIGMLVRTCGLIGLSSGFYMSASLFYKPLLSSIYLFKSTAFSNGLAIS